ncbi:MAG: DnaT-like ssDNA-binding domain-containing protein [Pseudomonadota bacterium]
MANSHLIPQPQLQFSADLAATIGLEEAILIQQIRGLYQHQPATERDGAAWLHVSRAYLLQLLPFWSEQQLNGFCESLEGLGLLQLDRQRAARDSLLLALSNGSAPGKTSKPKTPAPVQAARSETRAPAAENSTQQPSEPKAATEKSSPPAMLQSGRGEPLPRDFQPSEDMLELLEQFHGVPRGFSLQQLEDFTLYWRERGSAGYAWQNKFKQHVQFHWARHQQAQAGTDHGGQQGPGGSRRTRDSSIEQDLTDTSWAD